MTMNMSININININIHQVELLVGPEVKTLFVFSDDIDWIRKESELLKVTHPDYNVYFLDDPHLRKRHLLQDSEKLRYGLEGVSATESGVYLFASLKLASQVNLLTEFKLYINKELLTSNCMN